MLFFEIDFSNQNKQSFHVKLQDLPQKKLKQLFLLKMNKISIFTI